MADQDDAHQDQDEAYIHPEHLAKPEKLGDVFRDVAKGLSEFVEGEPLVGEQDRKGLSREDDEGPLEGGGLAP